jgi:ABC-2 type transport system permease protein
MNRALWTKSIADARSLLLGTLALMLTFPWVFIWLTSQIPLGNLKIILSLLPPAAERMSAVPLSQVATTAGRIAVAYDHPLVLFLMSIWGIARGSDAVAGELGRGTLEMVLSQPVRRFSVLVVQASVTTAGALLLATAVWLSTWLGLATIELEDQVSALVYLPPALNVFSLTFFLAGVSTMASSWDRYRSRTIGLVGAFYVVSMILMVMARGAPGWEWLGYFSFFNAFEPQRLVAKPAIAWQFWVAQPGGGWQLGGLGYDSILVGLGLAGYGVAATIFCRRDLPAPL